MVQELKNLLDRLESYRRDIIIGLSKGNALPTQQDLSDLRNIDNLIDDVKSVMEKEEDRTGLTSLLLFSACLLICLTFTWIWGIRGASIDYAKHAKVEALPLASTTLICFGVLFETWRKFENAGNIRNTLVEEQIESVESCGAWILLIGLFAEISVLSIVQILGLEVTWVRVSAFLIPVFGTIICAKYGFRVWHATYRRMRQKQLAQIKSSFD